MDMRHIFEAIDASSQIKPEPGDYNEGGLLVCGKCHTPKQVRIEVNGIEMHPYVLCRCEAERIDREEAERKRAESAKRIDQLRRFGFHDPSMARWTFEADDGKDERLSRIARNYVNNFEQMKADGKGLLLWGGTGSGKTFAAVCIANALIDRGIPCLVTNFARLTNAIGATFNDRQKRIDDLDRFDLLVIDDLASERETEYMNELVFSIIDARYRSGKPIIVTTNLTAEELKNPNSMHRKRIYSRLMEMCVPVKVSGADRRRDQLKSDYERIARILGL